MQVKRQEININALTYQQPFCAGLLLIHRQRLVLTLAKPKRWKQTEDGEIRISLACVGGGQELGESIIDCASREAQEEIGCEVRLRTATQTYWVDLQGKVTVCQPSDAIAPLLFQWQPGPGVPYKDGLPVGPILYVAHYLAEPLAEPVPCDVPALIEFSASDISTLQAGVRLSEAIQAGMVLKERSSIPREAFVCVPPGSSEARLLQMVQDDVALRFHN